MASRLKSASSVRSVNIQATTKRKKSISATGSGGKAKKGDGKKKEKLEFPCSACEREGNAVEATSYCADCEENVCADCVKQHQKYPAMKKHVIRDSLETKTENLAEGVGSVPYNPVECTMHKGKIVDMYCDTHDELWCSECVASKHENCKSCRVITEASKDVFETPECQGITEDIRLVYEQLKTFRSLTEDNMEKLVKLKTEIMSQIKEYRNQLEKAIINLETATLQELENAYERGVLQNEDDRNSYTNLIDTLGQLLNIMLKTEKDRENEGAVFIAVKRAKEIISEGHKIIGYNKHAETSKPFNFVEDRRLLDWIKSFHTLGAFSYQSKTYSASLLGNYPVNHKSDSKTCDVYGTAVMEDGRVLLADWDNKSLKMLDRSYKLIQAFSLPGNPCSVCCVSPDEAAVSLTNQKVIQFVSTRGEIKLLHSLRTGENCRGIDCHGGKLFVLCGGFKGEGDAKLNIYTLAGDLVRVVERNCLGQRIFLSPISIAVAANARTYYVTDGERGVITLTYKNDVISVFSGVDISWPCGICLDRNDSALVCSGISNTVVQLTGINKLGAVATSNKGVSKPHSIAFDHNNLRLVVSSSNSKVISVYQLEVEDNKKFKSGEEDIPPVTVTLTKPQPEPKAQKTPKKTKGAAATKQKEDAPKQPARSKTQVQILEPKSPKPQSKVRQNSDKGNGVEINGSVQKTDTAANIHINDDVVNVISKMLLSEKPTKPENLKKSVQKALNASEKNENANAEPVKDKMDATETGKATEKTSDVNGISKVKVVKEKTMMQASKRDIASANNTRTTKLEKSSTKASLTVK